MKNEITALRSKMVENGYDLYFVVTADYHDSEYVGEFFKCRQFLSGFSGSNGTLVVTKDKAALFTDGRYFLQAEQQLKDTGIDLMRMGEEGVPSLSQYILSQVKETAVLRGENYSIGFDGKTVSYSFIKSLKKLLADELENSGVYFNEDIPDITKDPDFPVKLLYEKDLVDEIWEDRPALSAKPLMVLDEKYSGESADKRLLRLREKMENEGAAFTIISTLDDIAWLLNIRGTDVDFNPVVLSYLIVGEDEATIYLNESILDEKARAYFEEKSIKIKAYNDIYEDVKQLNNAFLDSKRRAGVIVDPSHLNYALYENIDKKCKKLEMKMPTQLWKAIKNPVEVENERNAHIKDAVALINFFYYLKTNVGKEKITELSAAKKLEEFRQKGEGYQGQSFEPIFGYGPHGAIVHYEATPESDVELKPESFVLIDTGGQYLDGTTDVTRTIPLGKLTPQEMADYTLVLKSHLALLNSKFIYGTRGVTLDYAAREPMWEYGLDYNHGTGHGVGFFLNVHEAPNNFRYKMVDSLPDVNEELPVFEEGMITSDEPGVYITGKFGVRLESLFVCVKDYKNDFGQFMRFEPLTMVPFDKEAINLEFFDDVDIDRLNSYHELVRETMLPHIKDKKVQEWLVKACRKIKR